MANSSNNNNLEMAKSVSNPLPEELLWKVLDFLPLSRIYELRGISPLWNRICSTMLEEKSCLVFNASIEMGIFIARIPRHTVFGTYPGMAMFEVDVNVIVADGGPPLSVTTVMDRFDEFCQATRHFNTAWGPVVKHWNVDLQLAYPGVPGRVLFQETVHHLLTYFPNVQRLVVKLPIVHMTRAVADTIAIPAPSRSRLLSLSLDICNYTGAYHYSRSEEHIYAQALENVMVELLSATDHLESLEVYSDQFCRSFTVNGIVANAGVISGTLTTLILTSMIKNEELAQLVGFTKLKKVEICVQPEGFVPSTLANFLSSCAASLKYLTVRFIGDGDNALKFFPPNIAPSPGERYDPIRHPVHLSQLESLSVWGFKDVLVKLSMMTNLMTLCTYQCSNLKVVNGNFTDNMSFHLAPMRSMAKVSLKNPLLSVSGLKELHFYLYSQMSIRGQLPSLLLTSLLTSIKLDSCDFFFYELLGSIFAKCPKLETLYVNRCEGLLVSDAAFCDGGNTEAEQCEQSITRLVDESANDEELRKAASAYDTSDSNRHQISNLKALKSFILEGAVTSPLTDTMICFGLCHCASLTKVELLVDTQFSARSRRLLEVMLPNLNISNLRFN